VGSRVYEGPLLTVINQHSFYKATPNHRCVARLREDRQHWQAVYLMRKGDNFRVGKTAIYRKNEKEFGLSMRARQERADAIWLLDVFETKEEALAWEQVIAANYGIPDICFINSGELAISQERLDWCWTKLGNNEVRAEGLLTAFGRLLEFPIWEKGGKEQIAASRQCLVRACNLVPELFEVPYVDYAADKLTWCEIDVRREDYSGLVYSLEVEKTESTNWNGLYIANDILTGNSIYGFRGAHEDSMNKLAQEFQMKELSLTMSFRCPEAIVSHAQWRAPHMRAHRPGGSVTHLDQWGVDDLPTGAYVLCRNNAPLFRAALRLLRAGRHVELGSGDVAKSLHKIMVKFGKKSIPQQDVFASIRRWEGKEKEKIKERGWGTIEDKAACMEVFAEQGDTLGDALAYINHLVNSSGPTKLLTVHKAKGLEADSRVHPGRAPDRGR
jgi:hypothetical protein